MGDDFLPKLRHLRQLFPNREPAEWPEPAQAALDAITSNPDALRVMPYLVTLRDWTEYTPDEITTAVAVIAGFVDGADEVGRTHSAN